MKHHFAVATALLLAAPATAGTVIGFTDHHLDARSAAYLSDTVFNWAVGWHQTGSYTDVAITAILDSYVPGTSANWWLTRSLGPGTTFTEVVAQGGYTAPELPPNFDFNTLPPTILASGLALDAGTYFLVLDGPAGPSVNNAEWVGDFAGAGTMLAPGVSLLGYSYSDAPTAFGPASNFKASTSESMFIFGVTGTATGAVPEPASWAMLIAGFGLTGAVMRRRRRVPAMAEAR